MSYMKYNTRASGLYNTPGQFVPAGEQWTQPPPPPPQNQVNDQPNFQNNELETKPDLTEKDVENEEDGNARPHWMKSKLPGVKKISNKERRRRQNTNLRRLLTPKNALMVLNEMLSNEQVANLFKVEQVKNDGFYKPVSTPTFCAEFNYDGHCYKGYGENKLLARNAAAEQAVRDVIIKRMNKVLNGEGSQSSETGDEETIPMIQLASYALYKLFNEWQGEGQVVPQLRPTSTSASESEALEGPDLMQDCISVTSEVVTPRPKPPKKPKTLPSDAHLMHPCMLLTYMRPQSEYREMGAEGDRPQNMQFTVGIEVDGATYIGKAGNKRDARKAAARAACHAVFGVNFTN